MSVFDAALQERQPVACRLLTAALERKSLSNAYLLAGRAAADKYLISLQLAAFLNCLHVQELENGSCLARACAEFPPDESGHFSDSLRGSNLCQNCRWIASFEHPQAFMQLIGQGESGKIQVEKARALTEELSKTSRYMRVVVIPQAGEESLHRPSANALLKSIEEPQNCLFLLFAASAEQVLPTIVSRCQTIPVGASGRSGYWSPVAPVLDHDQEAREADKAAAEKLSAIKSEFIHSGRRRLSGSSSLHGSFLKAALESQELSRRMQTLSEDEGIDAEILLDLFLAAELEILRESGANGTRPSLYLKHLLELSESSKRELKHYVRKNNVLETFAYSLTELRSKYLGDFHLAKN